MAINFKNIENIKNATFEELIETEDIGDKIAFSVINYFRKEENLILINKLKEKNIQFEIKEKKKKGDSLEDKIIVISGKFKKFTREGLKKEIEDFGGKISSAISSKVNFIVAGKDMGKSKKAKAEKLGVKIITEEEFITMLNS